MSDQITFDEFKQIEIRMGKVVECEKVDGADKLLKLQVDFGSAKQNTSSAEQDGEGLEKRNIRQIISGIADSFTPTDLIGKTYPFVINLEHRKIRGEVSQAMILAIDVDDKTILLEPTSEVEPGAEVV